MAAPFVWQRGGRRVTPQELAEQRAMAERQRMAGMDFSPVGSVWEGIGRVASGFLGAQRARRAAAEDVRNAEEQRELLARIVANMGSPAGTESVSEAEGDLLADLVGAQAPVEAVGVIEPPLPRGTIRRVSDPNDFIEDVATEPAASSPTPLSANAYRDAIASVESRGSGDYAAIGRSHPTLGRPLGRYQVMEANLPEWSRAALGREVTPQEFLASPEVQDAIFDHRFGTYRERFGDELAADAWFAGPGGVGTGRRDALGTSVPEYRRRYLEALGSVGNTELADAVAGSAAPAMDALPSSAGMQRASYVPPAPPGPPQIDPAIIDLLASPYADDNVKQIAAALFQQQMSPQADQSLMKVGNNLFDTRTGEWIVAPEGDPSEYRTLDLRARAAGLTPGTAEYQQFMRMGGSSDATAPEARIARLTENLMATGDFMDPAQARQVATGIVDGRLHVDRHPVTGVAQIIDVATGRVVRGPGNASATAASPAPPAAPSPVQQGEPIDRAFGVEGAIRGLANRAADILGRDVPFPTTQEQQSNFAVLSEMLTNDVASAYDRQPPSWLLQAIRDLAPDAGSITQGASGAQSKLRALRDRLTGELQQNEALLRRELSPNNQQEVERRVLALGTAVGRINSALSQFGGRKQQPSGGRGGNRSGVPAGVDPGLWEYMTPEERALFQ